MTTTKTITREQKISMVKGAIHEGSWYSFGAGETGADLFISIQSDWEEMHGKYDGSCGWDIERLPFMLTVGSLSGDNGCNRYYNPTGEPWMESVDDLSEERCLGIFEDIEKDYPLTIAEWLAWEAEEVDYDHPGRERRK